MDFVCVQRETFHVGVLVVVETRWEVVRIA